MNSLDRTGLLDRPLVAVVTRCWQRSGPKWDQTLLIVNFDGHGGTYDHMPTPTNAACPDDSPSYFDFTRYGVRVPLLPNAPTFI